MSQLKDMYRTIVQDAFPESISVRFGDTVLEYSRRSWDIGGEQRGLRYGENPDQPAALYALEKGDLVIGGVAYRQAGTGLVSAITEENMVQAGKHPGKTNLTDVDNGINILQYLHARPACVILKHNNPCGAAWSDQSLADAVNKAYWSDRIAAFGGAVVLNRPLDVKSAEIISSVYFEVVAAPSFEPGALELLQKKKNLRILCLPGLACLERFVGVPFLDIKSLTDGGLVVQQSFVNRIRTVADFLPATAAHEGGFVAARAPSRQEADDLLFAWAVEAGVTSNSVIFVKDGTTVAIGTGEQDRVGCVEVAIHKAYTKYADVLAFKRLGISLYELEHKARTDAEAAENLADIKAMTQEARGGLSGTAMVSDGFFPFRDAVDVALQHGVTAIAQPGGSMRDAEVIMAVNESNPQVAMAYTAQRSFKH